MGGNTPLIMGRVLLRSWVNITPQETRADRIAWLARGHEVHAAVAGRRLLRREALRTWRTDLELFGARRGVSSFGDPAFVAFKETKRKAKAKF